MNKFSRRRVLATLAVGGAAGAAGAAATAAFVGGDAPAPAVPDARPAPGIACSPAPPDVSGLPAEVGGRIRKWADLGSEFDIAGARIVEAVRATGPEHSPADPGWIPTMTDFGDAARARAGAAGDPGKARNGYLEASFWYFLARFPHVLRPAAKDAYRKHTEAYLAAAQHFSRPLQVVQVPYAGGSFPAYLRLPSPAGGRWPAVAMWGGMDIWKSELEIHLQTEHLLDLGIATLTLDMPGTGESPIPLSPNAEQLNLAAVDYLRNHSAIDAGRIGVWGVSFGGYFAVKLALLRPELSAAVNNGGPVHHAFSREWFAKLPDGARLTLARIFDLPPATDPDRVFERLAELSLVTQKLLPAARYAPLLSLNGELDTVIPIADLGVISEYGIRQDRMIYGNDIHVAGRNWRHHYPMTAHWLATKLKCAAPQ